MNYAPIRYACVSVLALLMSATRAAYSQSDGDTAAIRKLYREWPRTVEAADPDRYILFLDDSVTLFIPGAPVIRGRESYRDALEPLFENATYRVELSPPSMLEIAGSWAFAHYAGSITTIPKDGKPSSTAFNRYIDILRRQPNGEWRVYVHSWHANASPR